MKSRIYKWLIPLLILWMSGVSAGKVQAVRGEPGMPEFGFGAVVYPEGPEVQKAMEMAVDLDLDWVRVPVAWEKYQESQDSPARFEPLEPIMQTAEQNGLGVLISVSDPPEWAVTQTGPDAELLARFILLMIDRFPNAVRAVELLPGANTRQGWGASPDPQDYMHLFQTVDQRLRDEAAQVLLVAAGLRPLPVFHPAGDVDDLVFLEEMYRLGASQIMPVISLQYYDVTGDPLLPPGDRKGQMLRHYEEVRQVMIKNEHQSGLIWITHLSLPSGKIRVTDSGYSDQEAQSAWISQVYMQVRSQLYLGVAFLPSLNSVGEGAAGEVLSLLNKTGETHPFYPVLRQMIRLNQAGSLLAIPGKAKEGNFVKTRP